MESRAGKTVLIPLLVVLFFFSFSTFVSVRTVVGAEDDFDNLTSLAFKVDGNYQELPSVFWFRYKAIGTPEEMVRIDITTEGDSTFTVILDKEQEKVMVKDLGQANWQTFPGSIFPRMWDTWRNQYIPTLLEESSTWEEMGGEYLIETEEGPVELYDIEVNEPIEDSVFIAG